MEENENKEELKEEVVEETIGEASQEKGEEKVNIHPSALSGLQGADSFQEKI